MEITNPALQTVAPNGNVTFAETVISGSCSISPREDSAVIKIKGITIGCCRKARFKASFGGNLAVATGETPAAVSLAITLDGEPMQETTMTVTPAAAANFFNVNSEIYIEVASGTSDTIGVTNISSIPVEVTAANLIVERLA